LLFFRFIEEYAANTCRSLGDMTLDEMETLWQESKGKNNQ
jgi:uncharacterized protein YabN with tetrapyrrole methylase and pyrophosphatase domain